MPIHDHHNDDHHHAHNHSHEHGQAHDHDHDGHGHHHDVHDNLLKSKVEAAAFLQYTLHHNAHHEEELESLAHSLEHLQLDKEALEIRQCIEDISKANRRLENVLKALS